MSAGGRKRFGEMLIERGIITQGQLSAALGQQQRWGKKLGETLVGMEILTEAQLVKILSEIFKLPGIDMSKVTFDQRALNLVAGKFCEVHHVIPVMFRKVSGKIKLVVASADPSDIESLDELRFKVNFPMVTAVASFSGVHEAIRKHYFKSGPDPKEITITTTVHPEDEQMEVIRDGAQEILRFSKADNVGVPGSRLGEEVSIDERFWTLARMLKEKSVLSQDEFDRLIEGLSVPRD